MLTPCRFLHPLCFLSATPVVVRTVTSEATVGPDVGTLGGCRVCPNQVGWTLSHSWTSRINWSSSVCCRSR